MLLAKLVKINPGENTRRMEIVEAQTNGVSTDGIDGPDRDLAFAADRLAVLFRMALKLWPSSKLTVRRRPSSVSRNSVGQHPSFALIDPSHTPYRPKQGRLNIPVY